jgi:DNA-binding MarR family transcriptional regulator
MTEKQKKIFLFIQDYFKSEGVMPRQIDIANHFGITQQTCKSHLDNIQKRGWITRLPGLSRSIHLNLDSFHPLN